MAPTQPREVNLPPDQNVGPALMIITGILTAFIIITTAGRLFVRFNLRILAWDDYTILIATILATLRTVMQAIQGHYGNGRHIEYLKKEDIVTSNMWGFYAMILLFSSICFLKTSIILLLLRIKSNPRLRAFLYAVIVGLFITNFGTVLIIVAQCNPPSAYWTGKGKCWDIRVRIYYIYVTIAYSIITDFLCSFLPLLVIWNVRIPLKKKIGVWSLMSLGLLATGFGIARAASLGISSRDLTWTYAVAAIWSNLELYLGIIAANLALSRSVFIYIRHGRDVSRSQISASYANPRSQYGNNSTMRPDGAEYGSTLVAGGHAPSISKSDGSEIPLETGIRKKTEFWVEDENSKNNSQSQGA